MPRIYIALAFDFFCQLGEASGKLGARGCVVEQGRARDDHEAVEGAVEHLHVNRSTGHTHMHTTAEHTTADQTSG